MPLIRQLPDDRMASCFLVTGRRSTVSAPAATAAPSSRLSSSSTYKPIFSSLTALPRNASASAASSISRKFFAPSSAFLLLSDFSSAVREPSPDGYTCSRKPSIPSCRLSSGRHFCPEGSVSSVSALCSSNGLALLSACRAGKADGPVCIWSANRLTICLSSSLLSRSIASFV